MQQTQKMIEVNLQMKRACLHTERKEWIKCNLGNSVQTKYNN